MNKFNNKDILIWLNSIGVDNKGLEKIISVYENLEDIINDGSYSFKNKTNLSEKMVEKIYKNLNLIEFNLDRLFREKVKTITIYDKEYPKPLLYIDDKPLVLYIKGSYKYEDLLSISIVGSRKPTNYGRWVCEKFTRDLSKLDVTIISGMALGIDTVSHETAIEEKNRTIAVLGSGINVVYPKINKKLYEKIIDNGAVISEFPLDTQPLAYNFPQRNRIISGLSLGTIVIEAEEKSGTLITAGKAIEQGKEVFSVPGNINSIYSRGTNKLIKDGAIPLLDLDDITENIEALRFKSKVKIINEYENLSGNEKKIINLLKKNPLHVDLIVYNTKLSASNVNSIISILELKGIIKNIGSKVYTLI